MRRRGLKLLRVALAAVMIAGLTAALVDFRAAVPVSVGYGLASVQFIPSALAMAAGAALALAWVIILVVTLVVGRAYCSVICPLGIYQDIVARVAGWVRRKKSRLPFRPESRWVRALFFWGTVAGIAVGGAGLTLTLLDPYSIYGRIASDLFRPLVTLGNNALVGLAGSLGWDQLYRVTLPRAGFGALALPAVMLVLVTGLAAGRGRLYCNTICPVGTLLGFVSARGAFRLAIDPQACRKCGDCLRECKAQCIDLRTGTIDAARCVGCYNCIDACHELGIHHQWSWGRAEPAALAQAATDPSRRLFLATTVATLTAAGAQRLGATEPAAPSVPRNFSPALCPPGAESVDRFLDRCTACHLCLSACPTHVLQPAFLEYGWTGLMKPRLDYSVSFCNFDCRRCLEVCPEGAITALGLEEKQVTRIGLAQLDVELCIVKAQGTDCAACSEHCPTKAVDTIPYGANLRLPQVYNDLCIGCGACEFACPAQPKKAIVVAGQRRHDWAQRKVEGKAQDPRKQADFPF